MRSQAPMSSTWVNDVWSSCWGERRERWKGQREQKRQRNWTSGPVVLHKQSQVYVFCSCFAVATLVLKGCFAYYACSDVIERLTSTYPASTCDDIPGNTDGANSILDNSYGDKVLLSHLLCAEQAFLKSRCLISHIVKEKQPVHCSR